MITNKILQKLSKCKLTQKMGTILYNTISSPNSLSKVSKQNSIRHSRNLPRTRISKCIVKRNQLLVALASVSYQPINADYLETEFSGHGVSFNGISDGSCAVKLGLDNGSVATVMLPSGMITSYKAKMWHGGLLEVLHTLVSEGAGEGEGDGEAVIQGGVTLAFKFECSEDDESLWCPTNWALLDVKGNPEDSIQVELISADPKNMIEVKHIITLKEDAIKSEIVIKNSQESSLCFIGSIMSHISVSTPEATYAIGLVNSNFFNKPPILSDFTILPPNFSLTDNSGVNENYWDGFGLMNSFKGPAAKSDDTEDLEGEEEDDYKHLTDKICRIYNCAPRRFTIMDRGKRNSVAIERKGFKEMYMFSPGSMYEWYGKYAYVCIGQSALLEPIILAPKSEWIGMQILHNPNM